MPDTIDERVLNRPGKGHKRGPSVGAPSAVGSSLPKGGLNNFQMTENNNLVISSAKGIGCSVVNIGATDIRCVDARTEQADVAARVAST